MALDYLNTNNIAVQRLQAAHDPSVSRVRTEFFAAEYAFFKKHISKKNVLVAGSGLGHDTFELARYNPSVVGVELHPVLIKQAKRVRDLHVHSNVKFIQGDFHRTTFASNLFGAAVLNMGTIGTLEVPEAALRELLRVARKVYADFYPPTPEAIAKRITMYTEEGWQNVRFDPTRGEIVSDDGMSSKSFTTEDVTGWANHCKAKVRFHQFCDIAIMAEFRK